MTGEIILVDEIHTCDCSRFWDAPSYEERFEAGQEPIRFDKDIIREWVKARCDPYGVDPIPEIPEDLIQQTSKKYQEFYGQLTGVSFMPGFPTNNIMLLSSRDNYFECIHSPQVICFGDIPNSFTERIQNLGAYLTIYRDLAPVTMRDVDKIMSVIRIKDFTTSNGIFLIAPNYEHDVLVSNLISETKYPVIHMKDYSENEVKNTLKILKKINY